MDWFERLTGFRELEYHQARSKLKVDGARLHSLVNRKSYGIGCLELVSLHELRERVAGSGHQSGRMQLDIVSGDVRQMHRLPKNAGALFQVASQFNLLEMTGPSITPEHGVTRYQHDHTQGPACAIAAGAATIYRNYFASIGGDEGQTATRQLDGLADLGEALARRLQRPVQSLWEMRNGYALCSEAGLRAITRHLDVCSAEEIDELRGKLRIGVHWDVEVTDADREPLPQVSQAFCSALPVAYSGVSAPLWRSFAVLVLEAAYEATLLAAQLNAHRGASNFVLLTHLGGGAFGNETVWIEAAMRRALKLAAHRALNVKVVSYGSPPQALQTLAREFS
jgi:hypothetical protein